MFGSNESAARFVPARTLSLRVVVAVALALHLSGCHTDEVRLTPQAVPRSNPTSSPSPSPSPSASPNGGIIVVVPTPAPVLCSPAPVIVSVAQQIVISCTEQGYIGQFTFTVTDPAIATVELAPGTSTLFYVAGVAVGTTTLSLESTPGGLGQATINVIPNTP